MGPKSAILVKAIQDSKESEITIQDNHKHFRLIIWPRTSTPNHNFPLETSRLFAAGNMLGIVPKTPPGLNTSVAKYSISPRMGDMGLQPAK